MGEKDNKHSNSSDSALFRDAVAGSRPLETPARHALSPNKPNKKARHRNSLVKPSASAAEYSPSGSPGPHPGDAFGEELSYNCGTISRREFRDLKRAKVRVGDELDLHGLTQAQAASILLDFLAEALERNYRCIRIVHGKGLRSGAAGPALKALVNRELRAHPQVAAFTSAPRSDGGTGAVYALLRTT